MTIYPLTDALEKLACMELQVFKNRTKTEGREECERAEQQHNANQQRREQRIIDGKRSGGGRNTFLLRKVAGQGNYRNHHQQTATKHVPSEHDVVPPGIGIKAGKCGAVITRA